MKSYKRIALENMGATFEQTTVTVALVEGHVPTKYEGDTLGEAINRAYADAVGFDLAADTETMETYGWSVVGSGKFFVWYDKDGAAVAGHFNEDVAASIAYFELERRFDL